MPEITEVRMLDDLEYQNGAEDGRAVPATEIRDFSLNGTHFRTYLSEENAERFDELFQEWTEYATPQLPPAPASRSASSGPKRTSSPGATGGKRTDRGLTAEIREWARGQGMVVNDRGRIPETINEAFFTAFPEKRPAVAA
jgi:hypothetical protein